ncbi:MAG: hypothetical protein RL885_14780 [Planctomycetota bacterium]
MRTLTIIVCLCLVGCKLAGRGTQQASTATQHAQLQQNRERQRLRLDSHVLAEPAPFVPSEKVCVAVLPFEVPESSGNRGEFESVFMALALAETLQRSPWVERAFVSPVPTEAVELVVEGEIVHSGPNAMDIELLVRRGDSMLLASEYGIRLTASDFGGASSPVRRIWIRPTNEIGRALAKSSEAGAPPIDSRVARYLGHEGLRPSDRVQQLFEKACEIERVKLLEPTTQMVGVQVSEVEDAYVTWQRDSTRAREQSARYRAEAAQARQSAADLKRRANNTVAAGVGLSLLRGLAAAQSGSQVNTLQMQADMQNFMNIAKEKEANARESEAEARSLERQAQVTFDSQNRFSGVFETNLHELTVTLQDQVYTLVGAVDAQIHQLRSIIRQLAEQEIASALAEAESTEEPSFGPEIESPVPGQPVVEATSR